METFYAYHAVTERPMFVGQRILFDEEHRSGVWRRVAEKLELVREIYAHPERYSADGLEHHTSVALRELALEEVRREKFPEYPSRLACLYVSEEREDAEQWAEWFAQWGRPVYQVVKLKVTGRRFVGDANNCFDGKLTKAKNLALAERYWNDLPNPGGEKPIREMLVDGEIEVVEIVKEIAKAKETEKNGHEP